MLYYCQVPKGNFGDDLNPWLWSRLAPEVCDPASPTLFLGIGTILSHGIPEAPVKVVFGSGWADSRPPLVDGRWRIFCVRGPVTSARLNLDPSLAITDAAVLVRSVALPPLPKLYPVSFMPHHWGYRRADWPALCARTDIHLVDPRGPVDQVLSELRQTKLLLAEAMHGAIIADALRVPWVPVRIHSGFCETKWQDWTRSMGVPLQLADVPPVQTHPLPGRKRIDYAVKKGLALAGLGRREWRRHLWRPSTEGEIAATLEVLETLPSRHPSFLSHDRTIESLTTRLMEKLDSMRQAWRAGDFDRAG